MLLLAFFLLGGVLGSELIIPSSVGVIEAPKGSSDSDLEIQFALGQLPLQEMCTKLELGPSRILFGCEKLDSVDQVQQVWSENKESSDWEALSLLDEERFGFDKCNEIVNRVMEEALGSAKIQNGMLSLGKSTPGETTGRIMFAVSRLSDGIKRTLSNEERRGITEFLLNESPKTSGVVLGLRALSDFGMSSVQVNQQDQVATVVATDLLGQNLEWELGKGTSPLVSIENNQLKVTFDAKGGTNPSSVPVELVLKKSKVATTHHLHFQAEAEFVDAQLSVHSKSDPKSLHKIGKYPSMLTNTISVDVGQVIEVSVKVLSGKTQMCPEQGVFALRFNDKEDSHQVSSSCSDGAYNKVTITNNAKLSQDLKYESGLYSLVFISSDKRVSNPVQWKLATVKLQLAPKPDRKSTPLFTTALLHESDTAIAPLPEIHHQFREEDRRAPTLLALIFTGVQGFLLVLLLIGLMSLGFNPIQSIANPNLLFFSATLALLEAVFLWYWIGPSGAPTMENLVGRYLPPLLLVLFFASKNAYSRSSGGTASGSASSGKKTGSL